MIAKMVSYRLAFFYNQLVSLLWLILS